MSGRSSARTSSRSVNDETGKQFTLQVYPDANNGALKAAGLPQQYYFQPQRVYLAKKQDYPADYDFGMTSSRAW